MVKVGVLVLLLVSFFTVDSATAGDVRKGRKLFKPCKACHSFWDKKKLFGPNLKGMFDRPMGSLDRYPYSKGLAAKGASGAKWTDADLDQFLRKPKDYLPDTKMTYPGMKNATDRENVIAYLRHQAGRK